MNEDSLKRRINLELESISCNQLNELGNQAVKLGLIAGHGYHKGQYEILRQGKALLMSPDDALKYLQDLIQSIQEGS
ncbi:MAG TPA: hypothetical protein V6C85_19450 [Allocoleopsis sp.]